MMLLTMIIHYRHTHTRQGAVLHLLVGTLSSAAMKGIIFIAGKANDDESHSHKIYSKSST